MTQQRVVRAIAQRKADFAHPTGWRWPCRRLAIKLRQSFIISKTRNAEITLGNPLHAQQTFFACRAQQRQPRPGVDIQQLINHRGDKSRFAAAAESGHGKT